MRASQLKAWTNEKFLATKHHQTLFGEQTFYRLDTLFNLVLFDRIWSCLINLKAIKHKKYKLFLLFSCLMSGVLFVWTAGCQTCLMRECVPSLFSLYQLFDLCLATHFNISLFGHQTMFDVVWSPNISRLSRP